MMWWIPETFLSLQCNYFCSIKWKCFSRTNPLISKVRWPALNCKSLLHILGNYLQAKKLAWEQNYLRVIYCYSSKSFSYPFPVYYAHVLVFVHQHSPFLFGKQSSRLSKGGFFFNFEKSLITVLSTVESINMKKKGKLNRLVICIPAKQWISVEDVRRNI